MKVETLWNRKQIKQFVFGIFDISRDSDKANTIEEIKLSTIVFAIDGDSIYSGCGLGLKKCNENKPCPVHNQFKSIRENLKNMLEQTKIKTLSTELSEGLTYLKS